MNNPQHDFDGRKMCLMAALLLSATSNALSAAAYHWIALVITRFFQAVGSAMVMVTGKVRATLCSDPKTRLASDGDPS